MAAEDIARSYFDAIARKDLDALASHYSADVVVDIPSQGVFRGPEEMRKFFDGLFKAIPDASMIADRVIGGDAVAVVQWRLRGTFTGAPLNGIEATGSWVETRGCDVIDVTDDRIARIAVYQDWMEVARSLGMMPPMGSAAEKAMIQAFNVATKARRALRERFG